MADDFVKIDTSGRKTQAPIESVDIAGPVAELIGNGINPISYSINGITLLQSSWVLNNGLWEYSYSSGFITDNSIVEIVIHIDSMDSVRYAKLMPINNSVAGVVKLFAENQPTADIVVSIHIFGEAMPEPFLPSQSGNAGKILSTDGTVLNWITVPSSGGGDVNIDGGSSNAVYLINQLIDGGGA